MAIARKRLTIEVDENLSAQIDGFAAKHHLDPNQVLTEALRQLIEREDARLSFQREAEASLEDHLRTQRHLSISETEDWLSNWGTKNDAPPPSCHD